MTTARTLRNYVYAVWYSARRHPLRFVRVTRDVMHARFHFGISPLKFSLFGLASVDRKEWGNYLLEHAPFEKARMDLNQQSLRGLADNKVLFFAHCMSVGLPVIPIVCHVGNMDDLPATVLHVNSVDQFAEVIRAAPSRLFVKRVTGSHGDGAFTVTRHDHDFEFAGYRGSAEALFFHLEALSKGNAGFIIQPRLQPHPMMLPFASRNGLPTIRAVTVITDVGPEVIFACLKITVGTDITDNFSNGASGNLVAGIDVDTGIMTPARGSLRKDWPVLVEIDSHPETGGRISGSRAPLWDDLIALVLRAQQSLPGLKTIGWDVAITPQGVLLVELNTNYGVHIHQVAYRRGLKAELSAKLGVVLG